MGTGEVDDIVELKGSMSSLERRGDWHVPRKLVLRWRMGSVKLDFTEARIVHSMVEIDLDVNGGSGGNTPADRGECIVGRSKRRGSEASRTTGGGAPADGASPLRL